MGNEAYYSDQNAQIERFSAGFLVIPADTGEQHWVPDHNVSYANWKRE